MERIMRIPEVVEVTGLSKTTIWRRVKSGDFPPPVRLGSLATRSVGWREGEVRRWLDSRPVFDEVDVQNLRACARREQYAMF